MFRILVGVLEAFEVGTLFDRVNAVSWFCGAVSLLVTEAILQGRKIFGAQTPASDLSRFWRQRQSLTVSAVTVELKALFELP